MALTFQKNWVSLLGSDPLLPPDVQFQVTEEFFVDGTKVERTELVGAHKFVLSGASDVFKAQFGDQILEEVVRNNINLTTKLIFLVFTFVTIFR